MPITKKVRDLLVPISEYAVTTMDKPLREAVPALRKLYLRGRRRQMHGGRA